jgi:hypothetical protein
MKMCFPKLLPHGAPISPERVMEHARIAAIP